MSEDDAGGDDAASVGAAVMYGAPAGDAALREYLAASRAPSFAVEDVTGGLFEASGAYRRPRPGHTTPTTALSGSERGAARRHAAANTLGSSESPPRLGRAVLDDGIMDDDDRAKAKATVKVKVDDAKAGDGDIDSDGDDDGALLLRTQMRRLSEARLAAKNKDMELGVLRRQLATLEATVDGLQDELAGSRRSERLLQAQLAQETSARAAAESARGDIRQLRDQLDRCRRALHEAQHAQAVAQREGSLAAQGREDLERASLTRTSELRDELAALRADKRELESRLAEAQAAQQRAQTERADLGSLHEAQLRELLAGLEQHKLAADEAAAEAHDLRRQVAAADQARERAELRARQLDTADQQLRQRELELAAARAEAQSMHCAAQHAAEERKAEERLRALAEERAATLSEQLQLLSAGNRQLQAGAEAAETARAQLAEAEELARRREGELAAATEALQASRAHAERQSRELAAWSAGVQLLHHRIARACSRQAGPNARRQRRAEEGAEDDYEGQALALGGDGQRERALPDAARAALASLDSLERLQAELAERAVQQDAAAREAQDAARGERERAQRAEAALAAEAARGREAEQRCQRLESMCEALQDEAEQAGQAAQALSAELGRDRDAAQRAQAGARRQLLRAHAELAAVADAGAETASSPACAEPHAALEDLAACVGEALREALRLADRRGRRVVALESAMRAPRSPAPPSPSSPSRPGSRSRSRSPSPSRPGRAPQASRAAGGPTGGWKAACLLLARATSGARRALLDLAAQKRVLARQVAAAEARDACLQAGLERANEDLRDAARTLGDGDSGALTTATATAATPLPQQEAAAAAAARAAVARRRLRRAIGQVRAAVRWRLVAGSWSAARGAERCHLGGGGGGGASVLLRATPSGVPAQDDVTVAVGLAGLFANPDLEVWERLDLLLRLLVRARLVAPEPRAAGAPSLALVAAPAAPAPASPSSRVEELLEEQEALAAGFMARVAALGASVLGASQTSAEDAERERRGLAAQLHSAKQSIAWLSEELEDQRKARALSPVARSPLLSAVERAPREAPSSWRPLAAADSDDEDPDEVEKGDSSHQQYGHRHRHRHRLGSAGRMKLDDESVSHLRRPASASKASGRRGAARAGSTKLLEELRAEQQAAEAELDASLKRLGRAGLRG